MAKFIDLAGLKSSVTKIKTYVDGLIDNVNTKIGNFAKVATSGSYNDLSDKPSALTSDGKQSKYVAGEAGTANADRHVWFSDSGSEDYRNYDDDFKYNPVTNTLTVGNISGVVSKASSDENGDSFADNYIRIPTNNGYNTRTYEFDSFVPRTFIGQTFDYVRYYTRFQNKILAETSTDGVTWTEDSSALDYICSTNPVKENIYGTTKWVRYTFNFVDYRQYIGFFGVLFNGTNWKIDKVLVEHIPGSGDDWVTDLDSANHGNMRCHYFEFDSAKILHLAKGQNYHKSKRFTFAFSGTHNDAYDRRIYLLSPFRGWKLTCDTFTTAADYSGIDFVAPIKSPLFTGDLTGIASKAREDAAGNNIINTYVNKSSLSKIVDNSSASVTVTPKWNEGYFCNSATSITINAPAVPVDDYEKAKDIIIRWNCSAAPTITMNSDKFIWEYGEMPEFGKAGEINIAYAGDKYFCVGTTFGK